MTTSNSKKDNKAAIQNTDENSKPSASTSVEGLVFEPSPLDKSPEDYARQPLATTQIWNGPLPPPEDLARFNQVVPGAAQIILDMAIKEQDNRHKMEAATLKAAKETNNYLHTDKNKDRNERLFTKATFSLIYIAIIAATFYKTTVDSSVAYDIALAIEDLAVLGLAIRAGFFANGSPAKEEEPPTEE